MPLSLDRNLNFLNMNVVRPAISPPNSDEPIIIMQKLNTILKGVYHKKTKVFGVYISSNLRIDLNSTIVTQSLKVSYPTMMALSLGNLF